MVTDSVLAERVKELLAYLQAKQDEYQSRFIDYRVGRDKDSDDSEAMANWFLGLSAATDDAIGMIADLIK